MEKHITIAGLIAGGGLLIARIKHIIAWIGEKWAKFSPIIIPAIIKAEQLSLDGELDKNDRKQIATMTLDLAQQKGIIKLNWIEKMIANMVINKVAEKLPDFSISQKYQPLIDEAIKKLNDIKQNGAQPTP